MPVRATLGHLVGESLADGLTAIKAVQPMSDCSRADYG